MLKGLAALEATDWPRLIHAYGRATDTPGHLRALWTGDAEAHRQTLLHLWSAILHQGTPWTATGPAVAVVCGRLLDDWLECNEPLCAQLVSFLVEVAEVQEYSGWSLQELERQAAHDIGILIDSADDEAMFENEETANTFYARSILGCVKATPLLSRVMAAGLSSAEPEVRKHASEGVDALARSASMRAPRTKPVA